MLNLNLNIKIYNKLYKNLLKLNQLKNDFNY